MPKTQPVPISTMSVSVPSNILQKWRDTVPHGERSELLVTWMIKHLKKAGVELD